MSTTLKLDIIETVIKIPVITNLTNKDHKKRYEEMFDCCSYIHTQLKQ